MADWKEKLKKVAEQQGVTINHAPQAANTPRPTPPARELKQQTRKIKFDKNPRFNRKATAPYNFVPLNRQVIAVTPFSGFDAYDTEKRKTGYIDCDLEALTPLYIRDTLGAGEYAAGRTGKQTADFFSPGLPRILKETKNGGARGGKTQIPGSSWRGMIRNLVEILSWSRLDTDEQRLFYYRGLADQSNLRKEYQSHMSSYNAKTKAAIYKMSAGYLEKAGVNYRIVPARRINGKQFYQILKAETAKAMAGIADNEIHFYQNGGRKENCFFRSGPNHIVISGAMPNKKRDWVIHPPDLEAAPIGVPEADVRSYWLDENRTGPNLIAELERLKLDSLPCFYVEWMDNQNHSRVSFGHTAMFRLAYEQSAGDLLPEGYRWNLNDNHPLDLAESIFGTVAGAEPAAGRVYFEDAPLVETPAATPGAIPQILSTPKPTTFQHYLVQTSDFIRELSHYNSDTALRGHKLYWHRQRDWQAKDLTFDKAGLEKFLQKQGLQFPAGHRTEKKGKVTIRDFPSLQDENLKKAIFAFVMADDKSQYTVIKPVPPGAKFKGKIRFENLTDVELGALLFALQLPENCRHKIGMGKPLGLGSVKITPVLFLSDRKKRYTSLLHEWATTPQSESEETVKNFQKAFERHILDHLEAGEKPASGKLWDTYRLRQLRMMLDWNNTQKENWNEKTRYLEIEHPQNGNEYKTRPVLPIPEEVVKG